MDERGIAGIGFYFVLQGADGLVDVPQGDEMRMAPHGTAYFVAGQGASGPLKEQAEHLELAGAELYRLSAAGESLIDDIEPAVAEFINVRLLAAPAPHKRLGPGQKLFYTERLGHIVVRAKIQSHHDVGFLVLGGQHDYRHVEILPADLAAYLKPVDLGQHDIENDKVGFFFKRRLEALLAVASCLDAIALQIEVVLQAAKHRRIVLDNKYALHYSNPFRRRLTAGRQFHGKRASFTGFAADSNRTFVGINDKFRNTQAQAATFGFTR